MIALLNAQVLQNLLLFPHKTPHAQQLRRVIRADSEGLWLLCAAAESSEQLSSLEWLVWEQTARRAEALASCVIDQKLFLLMRPNAPISSLFGALELAQAHFEDNYSIKTSYVLCVTEGLDVDLNNEYDRILHFIDGVRDTMTGFIHLLPAEERAETEAAMGSQSVVEVIIEYIRTHLREDLSLSALSQLVGYNSAYLSRLFHEQTGEQTSSYIAKLKIDQLNAMMADEEMSFNAIAEALGFNSRSYFNRYVKRMTGLTPQRLRDAALADKTSVVREDPRS